MRMQTKHRTPLRCGVAHVSIAIHTACVPTLRVFVHVAQHPTSYNKLPRTWLAVLNSATVTCQRRCPNGPNGGSNRRVRM